MAISFVGANSASGSSVSIPTHQAGDLILIFAYRDGSNTPPEGGSGYITAQFGGSDSNSTRVGFRIASNDSETSGTWTNATGVVVHVYRGTSRVKPTGSVEANQGSSSTISYSALNCLKKNNTSWVAAFAGHRSATNIGTNTPSGYTHRTAVSNEVKGSDTNGAADSVSLATQSVNASSGWRSVVIEIMSPEGKIEDVRDGFPPSSLDYDVWGEYLSNSSISTNFGLEITTTTASSWGSCSVETYTPWDMTDSCVVYGDVSFPDSFKGTSDDNWQGVLLRVVAAPTSPGNDNLLSFELHRSRYSGGDGTPRLSILYTVNGSPTILLNEEFDPVGDAWLRVRESGGTVYWDTSPDGYVWTNRASVANPIPLDDVISYIYVQSEQEQEFIMKSHNIMPFRTLQDDFSEGSLNPERWSKYDDGTHDSVVIEDGKVKLTRGSDIAMLFSYPENVPRYSLVGNHVFAEFYVPDPSNSVTNGIEPIRAVYNSGNRLGYGFYDGQLYWFTREGGSTVFYGETTYNPSDHKWLRVRESSGIIYFEASPNGIQWTILGSDDYPLPWLRLVYFESFTYTNGIYYVDSFNVIPGSSSFFKVM